MNDSFATINGVVLWHISQGQGIPIVLLHGGPGAYDYLELVAKLLDDHYQAIRYERTGINPQWHEDYRVNRLNKMSDKDREEYTYLRSIINTLDMESKERVRDRIRELSLRTDLYNQKNYDKLPRVEGCFSKVP